MGQHTIVTPINKNVNSNSNKDFIEQEARHSKGLQIMWDDAKGNPTKLAGGAFGFVRNSIYVDIHIVTHVKSTDDRLDSWSRNVGQGDRNVLYLTPRIMRIDWKTWVEIGCLRKVQGTARIVSAHNSLSQYLKDKQPVLFR